MGETEQQNKSKPANRENVNHSTIPEVEKAKSVTLKFVDVINAGDSNTLIKLQTEDFTFIDMEGDVTYGRDGWSSYFSSFPKYKIHVQHILTSGNRVAIIGKTTGSHVTPEVEEIETVLWTAKIRNGLVTEWRIYSDIKEAKRKVQKTK